MLAAHRVPVGSSTPVDLTQGVDVSHKYEIRLRWGNTQNLILGPATVSESTGFNLLGATYDLDRAEFVAQLEDERLYGIAPSGGGTTVQVLMFSVGA